MGKRLAGWLGLWMLAVGGLGTMRGQTVAAVPALDLQRFTGTWYEVAVLPNKRQKRCVRDAVILVALGDKARSFTLVSACGTNKGFLDVRNESGKAQDKSGGGKLKVTTLWPFSRKVWVLGLGPDYEWALLGSPNHKAMAVLSRTAVMEPGTVSEVEGRAAGMGFPVGKLVRWPETERYGAQ